MGGVWEHYGALWVVCGSIMEHYGWCVGALWVVCGSIRERNYRLKKKNYLSGPRQEKGYSTSLRLLECRVTMRFVTAYRRQGSEGGGSGG